MKIGIDIRKIDDSGIGTYLKNLLLNLSELDTENEYHLFVNKIPSIALGENFHFEKVKSPVFLPSEQVEIPLIFNKLKLDVMHSPHFLIFEPIAQKTIVTIHDIKPLIYPESFSVSKRGYLKLLTTRSILMSASIISVSENTKKEILDIYPQVSGKIKVILEGVDKKVVNISDELKDKVLSKYKVKKDFLLYVGIRHPLKNLVRLIKSYNTFIKATKCDWDLVIVGKNDERYKEPEVMVSKLNIKDRVIFTGLVDNDELNVFYKSAKAFVFPTLHEGFGLPVLEAMAMDLPVICSNNSSLPEVAGDAALMFNPKDERDISDKLIYFYLHKEVRNELVRKGREQVKKFSWKKMAEETMEVYKVLKVKSL